MPEQLLIRDKEVARIIGMSPSWVRVQRWKRRRQIEHSFTVDPLYIGSSPRYKTSEVMEWLESLRN